VRPAIALLVAALASSVSAGLAAPSGAGHPSTAVARSMVRAVEGRLCYRQNAWVSRRDPHYGVIITQVACGGSHYDHWWLRRGRLAANARWTVVDEKQGTIDDPAGCT
jgi:hypothetical protein